MRGLRDYFEIAGVGHGQDVRYQLVGWAGRPLETRPLPISARLMAEVLRSGGNEGITMRHFLQRVSDEEMESLLNAVVDASSGRVAVS